MLTKIVVPQIFENMEEATVGVWLKNEGDAVAVGDALCELITEKTTFQLESDGAGILRKVVAPAAAIVPVGATVAWVGDAEAEIPVETTSEVVAAPLPEVAALSVPTLNLPTNAEASGGGTRVRATPAARRAAKERGVALEDVAAKFPGKVLGEDDVKNF
ncbi:MAG TPA: biotin/lipoyl-containing protein [Abditibacteriaceae bacterium]|jgi:pyruvate dehydrogenase E2 component (dihydrolipoamide acetyltransferase)